MPAADAPAYLRLATAASRAGRALVAARVRRGVPAPHVRGAGRHAARWATTVAVLSYDEHGGFWDYVPPPVRQPVPAAPGGAFASTGPRVPAVVISPLVDPASVCHAWMDHTSVLQLLAERFGAPGEAYSASVAARATQGIASVSAALTRAAPRPGPPPHAPDTTLAPPSSLGSPGAPADAMQGAFAAAIDHMVAAQPDAARAAYPDLVHWHATRGR